MVSFGLFINIPVGCEPGLWLTLDGEGTHRMREHFRRKRQCPTSALDCRIPKT